MSHPQNLNLQEIAMVNRIFAQEIAAMVEESESRRRKGEWRVRDKSSRRYQRKHITKVIFFSWMTLALAACNSAKANVPPPPPPICQMVMVQVAQGYDASGNVIVGSVATLSPPIFACSDGTLRSNP